MTAASPALPHVSDHLLELQVSYKKMHMHLRMPLLVLTIRCEAMVLL
jgi:hypothetical protein